MAMFRSSTRRVAGRNGPPAISDPIEPDSGGEHCELRVPNCAVSVAYKAGRLFDRILARVGTGDEAIVVSKDLPIKNDTDRGAARRALGRDQGSSNADPSDEPPLP